MVDTSTGISQQRIQDLTDMAHKLRIHAVEMTNASNSGYIPLILFFFIIF